MFDVTNLRFYNDLREKGIINDQQEDLDSIKNALLDKRFECLERLEIESDNNPEINDLIDMIDSQLKEIAKIKATITSSIIEDNEDNIEKKELAETVKTTVNHEVISNQKTKDKKIARRIAVGTAVFIVLALVIFMVLGPGKSNSEGLNTGDSKDYYGITSRQLENKVFERFKENNDVEILDVTSEVFNERGTLGYSINDDPSVIMIIYTQSPSESYDYDSPIDYCCIISEISDYSTYYIAKAICEVIDSPDEAKVKTIIDNKLNESKVSADNDANGQDHYIEQPLDNKWTLGLLRLERTNHDIVIVSPQQLSAFEVLKDSGFVGE